MKSIIRILVFTVPFLILLACTKEVEESRTEAEESNVPRMENFKLVSSAFSNGSPIPSKYTCKGDDVNPPLEIQNPPEGTQSFVLIMDDPDAPGRTWDHWILWNISGSVRTIAENSVPTGAILGSNSFEKTPYGGPCPPPGNPHRYFFKLYALSANIDLAESSTKKDVLSAMKGEIIATAELMGTFQK